MFYGNSTERFWKVTPLGRPVVRKTEMGRGLKYSLDLNERFSSECWWWTMVIKQGGHVSFLLATPSMKNPFFIMFYGSSTIKWGCKVWGVDSVSPPSRWLLEIQGMPGYPNKIPLVDWQTYLPTFNDEKGNDASIPLFRFHKHIHKMGVGGHEDSLMKLFMFI